MALIAGTGAVGKNKAIKCSLSGFSGTGESSFGNGGDINCENIEWLSLTKPEKSENNTEEFNSNARSFKDSIANTGWEDWSGLEVFNDEGGVNWKAFIAAQETDATGTITLTAGTSTIGSWKAKVAKAGGGGGEANGFDTSFTPTFTLIEAL